MISEARKALKLDHTYGCAPHDYWTNRAPFPSQESIFSWLQEEVLPDMVRDEERGDVPRIILTNTGALRFDIFEGPFTTDTMYTVSPFTSGFRSIKDVPYGVAKRLLVILNQEVPQLWPVSHSMAFKSPAPAGQIHPSAADTEMYGSSGQITLTEKQPADLTPGYTTRDDAGSDGDDTVHSPITFYRIPNALESRIGFSATADEHEDPASVDIVYVDFIESYILLALKFLGTAFTEKDTAVYMKGHDMTDLIGQWVRENWKC